MASQSVLELAVNTGKWDSGLKQAKSALDNFTTASGGLQQALGEDADKMQKFVQMMGSMESKAKTAKGQMNDYKSTIEQLTMQYNRMTEAQQKTIGQEYLNTIEQLKKKYHDVSQEQQEMNRSLQNTNGTVEDSGDVLDKLTKRFTVNIDAVKLFNVGLQAAQGALGVVKDAFFNNEEQLDEWGRVVESSKSLYDGFLNALNTGDISGYIDNIGNIVKAARDAYDALDALSTFNAFNQINVEKTRTGMTEAIVDYREGNGNKEAVKASGEAYKKELQERQRLERDAYLAAVAETAAKRGVSAKDLMDALSGTYGHYQDLKKVQPTGERMVSYGNNMFGGGGYYTEKFAQNDRERLGEALRHLNDTELQSLQALGAQAERTGNEIAGVDRQLVRVLNGRQGTAGGNRGGVTGGNKTVKVPEIFPENSLKSLTAEMQELQKAQQLVSNADEWRTYEYAIEGVKNQIKELKGELPDITTGNMASLAKIQRISTLDMVTVPTAADMTRRAKQSLKNFKVPEKQEAKLTDIMSQMNGGISSMVSGIEGLGIELPKGMKDVLGGIQSVTSILSGISTIVAAIEAINAADTIIPFASGGVVKAASGYTVPGRRFSGDMIPARLNAGELVLNQAQAGVIANALQDREFGGGVSLQPYVDGEKIFLGMNNTSKRMGRGEIVTTSTLRRLGLI